MEIDGKELCLVDPVSTTVLSVQPIHTIRVWGVGSQNSWLVFFNLKTHVCKILYAMGRSTCANSIGPKYNLKLNFAMAIGLGQVHR